MTFHVGQMVVCVDDKPAAPKWGGVSFPVRGRVYTIRAVFRHTSGADGVWLEELRNPFAAKYGLEWGYKARRFRPVKTTSIDQFTALLNPAPEKELAQ